MASLAILVSIIFISTITFGPLSLLLCHFKFKILSILFAILAIMFGIQWLIAAPFPISIIGLMSLLSGIAAIIKNYN